MESFPFTSYVTYDDEGMPVYDRAVDSYIFRNVLKQYVYNGVFPNPSTNFQVIAAGNMRVQVKAGSCIINGATGYEVENRTLQLQEGSTLDRIDTVILRLNDNTDYRNIDLYVLRGTPSANPVRPALTRRTSVWELGLCDIFIPRNSSVIKQERITDTRLEEARCGLASFMQHIDTSVWYNQIQSDLANFKNVTQANYNTWVANKQAEYNSWTSNKQAQYDQWVDTKNKEFDQWFKSIQQREDKILQDLLDYINRIKNKIDQSDLMSFTRDLLDLTDRVIALENSRAVGPGLTFGVVNGILTVTY